MKNNIAVNGRYLMRRITGVERYAHEISKRLQPRPRTIVPKRKLNQISGHLWEQLILPSRMGKDEILWSPANSGPWMVRKHVVTIQDASVFDHPEWFRADFAAWTRLSWKILARTAGAIVTVSEFSRSRLKKHLNVPHGMIHVVPNCVGMPFGEVDQNEDELQARHGLQKPYFLFVGTQEPRKNLAHLFKAWEAAQRALPGFVLVIAGGTGTVFRGTGFENLPSRTQLLGYVPTAELPLLYACATAVVIPTLYEGFCIPALEAMACGAPLITSNTTALPEVTGDAAILVNPLDIEEIAQAMEDIARDKSRAREIRTRGLKRAEQFSWDQSARQIESILENLK